MPGGPHVVVLLAALEGPQVPFGPVILPREAFDPSPPCTQEMN